LRGRSASSGRRHGEDARGERRQRAARGPVLRRRRRGVLDCDLLIGNGGDEEERRGVEEQRRWRLGGQIVATRGVISGKSSPERTERVCCAPVYSLVTALAQLSKL
jgi:hypothetical protein